MVEYVELKAKKETDNKKGLHKAVYKIFIQGFISGSLTGIGILLLMNKNYWGLLLIILGLMGFPQRRIKNK